MRQYLHFKLSQVNTMAVVPLGRTAMIVFVLGIALAICTTSIYAQSGTKPDKEKPEKEKPDKTKAEQPLELPEFVITGVEALDVPGGAKQTPKLPAKLTTSDLRRFNLLDKVSFALLPQTPLPRLLLPAQERSGFLKGEFGMFTTPSIDAGYRAVLGNFDLNANAGATFSNGHLPNADFSDVYGSLKSTYLAPEKFLFFGASRTDTYLKVQHRAYRFFGASDTTKLPPQRSVFTLSGGVQTVGAFEGWVYDMSASVDFMSLSTVSSAFETGLSNTVLNGHILAKKTIGEWALGGKIDAAFQPIIYFDNFYYVTPVGILEFRNYQKTLFVEFQGGVQLLQDAVRIRGNVPPLAFLPAARLNASINLAQGFALNVNVFSGARLNTMVQLIQENPYTDYPFTIQNNDPAPGIPATHTLYDASIYARFQPNAQINFTLGGRSELNNTALVFRENHEGYYGIIYFSTDTTSIHRIFVETALLLDSNNTLTARINANFSSSARFGAVPYLAPLEASLEYRRYWLPALSTTLTGVYMGDRTNGGLRGTSERRILPAFVDIRLHVEYQFSPQFSIYARGTNLLNQPIFIWDGYRERGIFAALGAMLTF